MKTRGFKRIFKICGQLIGHGKTHRTAAVILAAGGSERMKDKSISKQLYALDGIPAVVHTLLSFEKCSEIHEIIVVSTNEEAELYKEFRKTYGITKLRAVTIGGSTRAISASHGFRKVSKECDFVAVHDAARCLITSEDIRRVITEAYRHGAAIAAKRMTDTVKVADENGMIRESPDRSLLWAAQTPQIFKKTAYEVALASAKSLDKKVTDDSMLVAQIGCPVKLVECLDNNMKLTTKEDLILAESILKQRKGEAVS